MKKILIVTNRTLHTAPRVIREIDALKDDFIIDTVGLTAPLHANGRFIHRNILNEPFIGKVIRKVRQKVFNQYTGHSLLFSSKLFACKKLVSECNPEMIICHEPYDLPYFVAIKDKFKYKLVYNAHEYYPLEFDDRANWASTYQLYFEEIYRTCLPKIDLLINVCDSFREKCLEVFGHDSIVVPNAAFYNKVEPKLVSEKIKLVHHGGAMPGRKIEMMIKMLDLLGENYELYLMLVPTDVAYFEMLKNSTINHKRVFFIDPVPYAQIVPTINQFDIGVYILAPTSFNNFAALPNKFYEFIQARLCIAIAPSPEMSRLVHKYQLGVVSDEFTAESLANKIKSITKDQIYQYKLASHQAAKEVSAEHYNNMLRDAILAL